MFEKESKNWVRENTHTEHSASFGEIKVEPSAEKGFQKGAEFGYNKANEWHYVKDGDLPKEEKKYYVYSEEWGIEVKKFFFDTGCFECRNNIIIAWKEIVLPKEI